MTTTTAITIGKVVLAVVLLLGAGYLIFRSIKGPNESEVVYATKVRNRKWAGFIIFILAIWTGIEIFYAAYNKNSSDGSGIEVISDDGAGVGSLNPEDMIPEQSQELARYEQMFGPRVDYRFRKTSLPEMAKYRRAFTSLYFENHAQQISDAASFPLWTDWSAGVQFDGGNATAADLSLGTIEEILKETGAEGWKKACEALSLEEREKLYRKAVYTEIISNPFTTESLAQALVDDPAMVNNREKIQQIVDDYEHARIPVEEETNPEWLEKKQRRGIGNSYWVEYDPGHAGDAAYLMPRTDQYLNGAFLCSLLEYYKDAGISQVASAEHWKNNCSGNADLVAPARVTDPREQESMLSYQMKFSDKSGKQVSWIGFNEADARVMKFTAKVTAKRQPSKPQQVPTTTTAATETTTSAETGLLQIVYLWDKSVTDGPGKPGAYPAPAYIKQIPVGKPYNVPSPEVKGFHITESSKKVISGEMTKYGATWNVYYAADSGGRRPGGGGGGGKRPTQPKPSKPSESETIPPPKETETPPTESDPTNPSPDESETDPSKPSETDPSKPDPKPDGGGGKTPINDPGANPEATNAPTGAGDGNGGPGKKQDIESEKAKDEDYSHANEERESKEDATQESRENAGKGDTTGTSNKVKEDKPVEIESGATGEGTTPPERETQPIGSNTGTETTTVDNGDGTSTTTEKTVDTGKEEVGGTLGAPESRNDSSDGDGEASAISINSNNDDASTPEPDNKTPDRSADPVAAPANNNDNNRADEKSGGNQNQSGSDGGGDKDNKEASDDKPASSSNDSSADNKSGGGDSHSDDGDDGDHDNGGLSDHSSDDGGTNIEDALSAPL